MTSTLDTTRTIDDTLQPPPIEKASRRRSLRNLGSLIKSTSLLSLDEKSSFRSRRQSATPVQHDDVQPVREPKKKPSRLKRLLRRHKKDIVGQQDNEDDGKGQEECQPQLLIQESNLPSSPPETPSAVIKKNGFGSVSSTDMESRRSSLRWPMVRPSQQQLTVSSPHSSLSERDSQSNTSSSSAGNNAYQLKTTAVESPGMSLASHQNQNLYQQQYQHQLPPQLPRLPESQADVSLWSSILLDADLAFKDGWRRRESLASSTTASTHTTQSTDGHQHVSIETPTIQPALASQTTDTEDDVSVSPSHDPAFCSMQSRCEVCRLHRNSSNEQLLPASPPPPPVLTKSMCSSRISLDQRRTSPPSIVIERTTPPVVAEDPVVMVEEEESIIMPDAPREAEALPEYEQNEDLRDVMPATSTGFFITGEEDQLDREHEHSVVRIEYEQPQPGSTTESIDQLEQVLHALGVSEAREDGDPVMIAGLTPAPLSPAADTVTRAAPSTFHFDPIDHPPQQVERQQHSESSASVSPSSQLTPAVTSALAATATATTVVVPNSTSAVSCMVLNPPISIAQPNVVAGDETASIQSSIQSLTVASSMDFIQLVESCMAHAEQLERLVRKLEWSETHLNTVLEPDTPLDDSLDEREQLYRRHRDRFHRMLLQQSTMLADLENISQGHTNKHSRNEENDRAFGFLRDTAAAGTHLMQARWYLGLVTGATAGTGKILHHGSKGQLIISGMSTTTEASLLPKYLLHDKRRREQLQGLFIHQYLVQIPHQARSIKFVLADTWVPDHEAVRCQFPTCTTVFDWINRRHHCRRCGHVLCQQHSANCLPLFSPRNRDEGEWARVCDSCFYSLVQ
ncbi:hypothetical protein BCR43DRAFT_42822 [Syncephalastrum racemosum]|uniref:FYVE-type domain-containing protein n=1 Tax=Syncephalastrum racemosum TaxID=13706 RepID=A0A1X2HUQ3_SYNRA|nr:hypothetical protein BCR43DRAFT_42822 [Syncephalastrum racemosum]